MLLAEANQWPEDAVTYFGDGDECHMALHFPLMPRLFMALRTEDRLPVVDIMEAPFPSVSVEDSVRDAAELLAGDRGALTVLDHGRPVGIVTRSDLLESLAR